MTNQGELFEQLSHSGSPGVECVRRGERKAVRPASVDLCVFRQEANGFAAPELRSLSIEPIVNIDATTRAAFLADGEVREEAPG